VVNATPWPLYPWERDPIPIGQEAGWAPGLVRTVVENLAPTGIQFLDCPSCSELLYYVTLAHFGALTALLMKIIVFWDMTVLL